LQAYMDGRIERPPVVSNKLISSTTQQHTVEQLIPRVATPYQGLKLHWDYLYEPDAKELLDGLMVRYVESQLYQAAAENHAAEQAARLIPMKHAPDNAGDLISDLQLTSNPARNAATTQEISHIVGRPDPGLAFTDETHPLRSIRR
ncbi:hypothetical protein EWW49_36030, partial [Pseudomonas syringae]